MKAFACFFLCFLVQGCAVETPVDDKPGFYYWKTSWDFDDVAARTATETGFQSVYLRLFDVDWDYNNSVARPRGEISLPDSLTSLANFDATPVVFIVNRVFREERDPASLADRIASLIQKYTDRHPALLSSGSYQIDCDWTPETRDAYFVFLRRFSALHPQQTLSVTVRLHQYRERIKNGIPPVGQGLLMCYNFAPVTRQNTDNAIFDLPLLKGYLKSPAYPLPLNAALPSFEWGAAFRGDRFLGLTDSPASLPASPAGNNLFMVEKDTVSRGLFLRPGDLIRYDGPAGHDRLREAVGLLRSKQEIKDLLFFDFQPNLWQQYGVGELLKDYYGQ